MSLKSLLARQIRKGKERFIARLLRNIEMRDGCMVWTGAKNVKGYPRMNFRDGGEHVQVFVHRLMYVLYTREDIPEGLTIDHQCAVRDCVDPRHMEVVTRSENTARMMERRATKADLDQFFNEFEEYL